MKNINFIIILVLSLLLLGGIFYFSNVHNALKEELKEERKISKSILRSDSVKYEQLKRLKDIELFNYQDSINKAFSKELLNASNKQKKKYEHLKNIIPVSSYSTKDGIWVNSWLSED
jgi:hypothetical protein